MVSLDDMRAKPVVWIIDPQQWPRAYLRGLLIERGFDAVGFMEFSQAVATLKDPDSVKPRIIVLELHGWLPGEDELAALIGANIPLVGIAGAVEMNQEWVSRVNWAALIRRPMTIGQIVDTIEKLILHGRVVTHEP